MHDEELPEILQEQCNRLIACQDEHTLPSCFECPEVLECTLRNSYIDAVYTSMSQGSNTDFDF